MSSHTILGGPWTEDEHRRFEQGLRECGHNWSRIANEYVKTRIRTQVASHAQKFFQKQKKNQQNQDDSANGTTPSPPLQSAHLQQSPVVGLGKEQGATRLPSLRARRESNDEGSRKDWSSISDCDENEELDLEEQDDDYEGEEETRGFK